MISTFPKNFKLVFFGSSPFVLPILQDIYAKDGQRLCEIWVKQFRNLMLENLENLNPENRAETLSKVSQEIEQNPQTKIQKILQNWWLGNDLLELVNFVESALEVLQESSLAKELADLTDSYQKSLESQGENWRENWQIDDYLVSGEIISFIIKIEELVLKSNPETLVPKVLKKHQVATFFLIAYLNLPTKLELVITQPDRVNRGKIVANPISQWSKTQNVNLEMPLKANQEIDNLRDKYDLQIAIVASFGQILNSKVLSWADFGILNWHPSSLPKDRGATPIQTALKNNDSEISLSWIKMTAKMDAGDIWLQLEKKIENEDNFETVANKMGKLGAETWALVVVATVMEKLNGLDRL